MAMSGLDARQTHTQAFMLLGCGIMQQCAPNNPTCLTAFEECQHTLSPCAFAERHNRTKAQSYHLHRMDLSAVSLHSWLQAIGQERMM